MDRNLNQNSYKNSTLARSPQRTVKHRKKKLIFLFVVIAAIILLGSALFFLRDHQETSEHAVDDKERKNIAANSVSETYNTVDSGIISMARN